MANQKKYNTFRQTFPRFVYESYRYDVQPDGLHISFVFRLNDQLVFEPQAHIPQRQFLNFDQPKMLLDTLVFNIGMVELISYWKCVCSPTVVVACGSLDEGQIAFWKKLYFNGLGEFFYINGIRATQQDFMTIVCEGNAPQWSASHPLMLSDDYLVPIGGGKDSVVTLELLQNASAHRPCPLIMNPRGATIGCIEAAGYTLNDVLVIKRSIHPLLLDLNAKGCLNGHTPFSAMLAFYSLLASLLSGRRHVALSNESSANESTVVGTMVNHQYSKSLEFEDDFRHYVSSYISDQFNYFSFLRPLSELQIAMLFSRFEHYHPVFRSCNVGSKQDIWCGHCPKCLFAYIILSPFIEPRRLDAIFGKCMLDDPEMRNSLLELIGCAETKPFECVGTISEVKSALQMTYDRWYRNSSTLPCLLADCLPQPITTTLHDLFAQHNLNRDQLAILKQYV